MTRTPIRRAAVQPLEARRLLAAVSWDGGGDGSSWGDAANWSNDSVPTSADDVTIDVPGDLTVDLTGTRSAGSLDNRETLLLVGTSASGDGRLILGGASATDQSINAGTIVFTSESGTTGGDTELRILRGTTLTNAVGGVIRGEQGTQTGSVDRDIQVETDAGTGTPGTFVNNGLVTFGAGVDGEIDERIVGGGFGAVIVNNGTFEATGIDGDLRLDTDVTVAGTLRGTGGGSVRLTSIDVTLAGTATTDGDVRFQNTDLTIDGLAGGTTLDLVGTNRLLALNLAGSTLRVAGTDDIGSATLVVVGDVTNAGTIELTSDSTGNADSFLHIARGGSLTNAVGGVIRAVAGAQTATSIDRDVEVERDGGTGTPGTFVNNGLVTFGPGVDGEIDERNVGGTLGAVIENNGVFEANGADAELDIVADFATTATLRGTNGGTVEIRSVAATLADQATTEGDVFFNNADLIVNGVAAGTTLDLRNTNTLLALDDPDATLRVAGDATFGTATLIVGVDMTNSGTILLTSESTSSGGDATLRVPRGVTFTNGAAGVIRGEQGTQTGSVDRDIGVERDGGTGTPGIFANNGLVSFGPGVSGEIEERNVGGNLGAVIVNNGTLEATGTDAELNLPSGLVTTGLLRGIGGGSVEGFSGTFVLDGGAATEGEVFFRNADLDVRDVAPGTVIDLRNTNTVLNLADPDATLRVVGDAVFGTATLNVEADITNTGTILLTSESTSSGGDATLRVIRGGSLTNAAGGVIRAEQGTQTGGADRDIEVDRDAGTGTPGTFVNEGLVSFDAGVSGEIEERNVGGTVGADIRNDGDIEVLGDLRIDDGNVIEAGFGFLSAGRVFVRDGGELALPSGGQLNADLTVDGSGTVNFNSLDVNNGAIRLTGGADATVAISAQEVFENRGILDLGVGSTLTLDGDAAFAGGSQPVLRSVIGPAGVGRLDVDGTLDLGPATSTTRFDPDLTGGFDPDVGDRFTVVTATGIADAFDSFQGGLDPSGDILTADADVTSIDVVIAPGPLPPAPRVLSQAFEFETRQAVVFQFDQDVSAFLGRGDFELANLTTGQTIDSSVGVLTYNQASNRAVFDFTNALPDGDYRLTIDAGDIANSAGVPASGSPITLDFFVLAGDFNRDRSVNLSDFTVLANNFGGSGRTYSQGDANYDGRVNLADFTVLANAFGNALPAADEGDDEDE